MERAGKSLSKMKSDGISTEALARAAWPVAVGKRIAVHAVAVALVRDKLVVECDDEVWRKQLFHLRHQILPQLRALLGDEPVRDLEFRTAIVRRPPQTALAHTESGDEADRIEDPILRMIYRRARSGSSA